MLPLLNGVCLSGEIKHHSALQDGIFIAAFDVEPAGKNKTKMTVYAPSQEELRTVPNAVEHWARGSNMGCPDLTKPYWY